MWGERVELGAAAGFGGLPFGRDPARLFELVQGGVQRAVADLQDVAGDLLEALGYGPGVQRLEGENLEKKEVQGALDQVCRFAHALPLVIETSVDASLLGKQGKTSIARLRKLLDSSALMFYIDYVITITTGDKNMSMTRYNPFDFVPFQAFRLLEEALPKVAEPNSARPWTPAVDILETENDLVIKADLPEVKQEQIDIRVEDGKLTLRGERKLEAVKDEKGYHRIERSYGSFSRTFSLPDTIEPEGVKATFKDGVLTVTLPKKELAKPRQIKVEVSN